MRPSLGSLLSLASLLSSASAAFLQPRAFTEKQLNGFVEKILAPRATTRMSNVSILFPAYLYPIGWTTPGAWDPLYNAIAQYPYINFHVVINPNSGPGGNAPNSDYAVAIQKLKSYKNAVLLGYIHTSYGSRSSDLIFSEIAQYSAWSSQGLAMNGIFYDEAPSSGTDVLYNYMKNITLQAKSSLPNATVYFNPGTIPDVRYYSLADQISIFEDTYANFLANQQKYAAGNGLPMYKSSFLIHSLASGWNQTQITSLVNALTTNKLGSLYVTSVTDQSNPYGSFGEYWSQFVIGVETLRQKS